MATKQTKADSAANLAAAEKATRMKAAKLYAAQPKISISISPMYRPYFGNSMEVIINGVYCAIPVDGKVYQVPRSFANEVARRIKAVDEQNTRADKLADVTGNHENYIGELQLF